MPYGGGHGFLLKRLVELNSRRNSIKVVIEKSKAIAILVAAILVMVTITGIFVFFVRPIASLSMKGREGFIELSHKGGDSLTWKDLRISVTKGKNSSPVFVNPTSPGNPLGLNLHGDFRADETINIENSTAGSGLIGGEWYHVIVKHRPTNVSIIDGNVEVIREYG